MKDEYWTFEYIKNELTCPVGVMSPLSPLLQLAFILWGRGCLSYWFHLKSRWRYQTRISIPKFSKIISQKLLDPAHFETPTALTTVIHFCCYDVNLKLFYLRSVKCFQMRWPSWNSTTANMRIITEIMCPYSTYNITIWLMSYYTH